MLWFGWRNGSKRCAEQFEALRRARNASEELKVDGRKLKAKRLHGAWTGVVARGSGGAPSREDAPEEHGHSPWHPWRMFGKGRLFDEYKSTSGVGFYEKFIRGEQPKAGWVNETDLEKQPIPRR